MSNALLDHASYRDEMGTAWFDLNKQRTKIVSTFESQALAAIDKSDTTAAD